MTAMTDQGAGDVQCTCMFSGRNQWRNKGQRKNVSGRASRTSSYNTVINVRIAMAGLAKGLMMAVAVVVLEAAAAQKQEKRSVVGAGREAVPSPAPTILQYK